MGVAGADLPAEFDHTIYVTHEQNTDLRRLHATEAWQHYITHGRAEGRVCSSVAGRDDFLALLPTDGSVLEIGPGWRPSLQGAGRPTRYLDILTEEELRTAAEREGGDPDRVPPIDFVWRGESYRELVGDRFDAVVSAHNIEHQTCLVTHLTDIASVLAPDARFFAVVPDRRYCFDHFIPDSSLVDVLDAFSDRRKRHTARDVIAHRLLTTHNDPERHWAGEHGPDPRWRTPDSEVREQIIHILRALRTGSGYIEAHAWQFTPDSFRYLIETLAAVGLSPLRIERLYSTVRPANEFFAVLRVAA